MSTTSNNSRIRIIGAVIKSNIHNQSVDENGQNHFRLSFRYYDENEKRIFEKYERKNGSACWDVFDEHSLKKAIQEMKFEQEKREAFYQKERNRLAKNDWFERLKARVTNYFPKTTLR